MKIEDYSIFTEHIDTLKEMSKDTSQNSVQYMTDLEIEAVNFDQVKRAYANALGLSEEVANSVDTLSLLFGEPVFIEFKNGTVHPGDIKNKIRDSLLIYGGITGENIEKTRCDMEFILVYNPQKNIDKSHSISSREEIAKAIFQKAKTEIIRFDLERYQKLYFRAVHTYTPEELKDYLVRRKNLES